QTPRCDTQACNDGGRSPLLQRMHHPRVGRVLASLALLASLILDTPAAVTAGPAPALVQASSLADASGQPIFVLGVNYEGPVDRPWRMWDNGQFDLGLIGKDLDRAKAANATAVRIFVQQALANDIRASNWDKLDRFLDLADQRGLRVILTLADYGSVNVSSL